MTLHRRHAPLIAALVLGVPTGQPGPASVEIRGEPKCPKCIVRRAQVGRIGDAHGPGHLETGAYAFDKAHGLAYVRGSARNEIAAFGLDGKFRFAIATPAGGVTAPDDAFALGPGDSLWILDRVQQRISVTAPGTARIVRRFPVSLHIDRVLPMKAGKFIGVTLKSTDVPDRIRTHAFFGDGSVIRAIGPTSTRASAPPVVALSHTAGRVWIARDDSYTIEQWGLDGRLATTVRRISQWDSPTYPAGTGRAMALELNDLYEDDFGLLWVSGKLPNPEWNGGAKSGEPRNAKFLAVLEVLNVPFEHSEFADVVEAPVWRLGGDYFVEPTSGTTPAAWRVVTVQIVER